MITGICSPQVLVLSYHLQSVTQNFKILLVYVKRPRKMVLESVDTNTIIHRFCDKYQIIVNSHHDDRIQYCDNKIANAATDNYLKPGE